MTKYIAIAVAFFNIYLAVRLEDIWMIIYAVFGFFLVIVAFILDATSKNYYEKPNRKRTLYENFFSQQNNSMR